MSKFDPARFLILGLVFVSRDFEVGTNVSCEESAVSPCTGLIFYCWIPALNSLPEDAQSASSLKAFGEITFI